MPKVSSYTQRLRDLTIEFEEDDDAPLHVVYNPRGITAGLIERVQAADVSGNASEVLYMALPGVLASWDLTDENDTPIPITREGLADIPVAVLLHVFQKIQEDSSPNSPRSSISPNGSAPTENEDRNPTGSSFSN